MPGSIWKLQDQAQEGSTHTGDQAGYDAAKAVTEASGGLLQVGPGLAETLALGTFAGGKTSLVRVTNTGKMFIGGLRFADGINPTKSVFFDPAGVAVSTERVVTLPDWSGLLPLPTDGGTAGQFLKSNGPGVQPSWGAVVNALLDGASHSDTVAQAVARGALVVGNATPKWDRLPIGAASTLLRSDGSDPSWGTVGLLSAFHGDTLAAAVAAGDIIFGNSTPKWASLPKGADGQALVLVGGLPAWSSVPAPEHNALAHLKPFAVANCTWNNGSANILTTGDGFANVKVGDFVVMGTLDQPTTTGSIVTVWTDSNNITVNKTNTGSSQVGVTLVIAPGDHWSNTVAQDSNGAGAGLFLTTGRGDYSATGPGSTFQEIRGPIRWMSHANGSLATDLRVQGSTSLVSPFGFRISKSTSVHATLYVNDLSASRSYRLPNISDASFLMESGAQDVASKTLKAGNVLQMDETGGTANGCAFRDQASPTKGLGLDLTAITAGQNRVLKPFDVSGRVPTAFASAAHTSLTGALGVQTLATAPAAGLYRLSAYGTTVAVGDTAAMIVRMNWVDPNQTWTNRTVLTINLTATNYDQQSRIVRIASGNLTYDSTYSGTTGTYSFWLSLERIGD